MTRQKIAKKRSDRFRYAIGRAFWVFIIALILQAVASGINPVATVVAKMRNASLDTLMAFVEPMQSPETNENITQIWFIGIDEYYEKSRLEDKTLGLETGTPRSRLAKVIRGIEDLQPRAIFLDLSLGDTANENDQKSFGDQSLIDVLDFSRTRDFPILVPGRFVAQESISDSPSVCPVSTDLFLDGDGLVRRIALSANNPLVQEASISIVDYGAVFYLERLAHISGNPKFDGWRWQDCNEMRSSFSDDFKGSMQSSSRKTYQQMNNRTIFKTWNWQRGQPTDSSVLTIGKSKWSNGNYLSAQAILDDKSEINISDAIFIVGYSNPQSRFTRDIYGTPVGPKTGAEIHYHSLMTKLHYESFDEFKALFSPIMLLSYLIMFITIFFFSFIFRDFDNILEFGITWVFILIPAVLLLNRFGFYMDYVLPLFVLEFIDSAYQGIKKLRGS